MVEAVKSRVPTDRRHACPNARLSAPAGSELKELTLETAKVVSKWLDQKSIHQWLDFGGGRQTMTPSALMIASRSPHSVIRVSVNSSGLPYGVIALAHVNRVFGTAMLWGLRPTLRPPIKSNMIIEGRKFLSEQFKRLDLRSIYALVVSGNKPSCAGMRGMGFRESGRQRHCHIINGQVRDRILFDITREEFFLAEMADEKAKTDNTEEYKCEA